MTDLKPCPFCGGKPRLLSAGAGNWWVNCEACKVSTNDVGRDRAVELWNDRVPQSGGSAPAASQPYQKRVLEWMMACFSMEICRDRQERNHRFLEEALELVQSLGCTASEAHQLVDYTFGRDIGEPEQELGGVMVTLAALCFPNDLNMDQAAEKELARVWTKIEKIRAKQAAKPKHSPLPEAPRTAASTVEPVARCIAAVEAIDVGYGGCDLDRDQETLYENGQTSMQCDVLRALRALAPAAPTTSPEPEDRS